jgi:hypothetical protein
MSQMKAPRIPHWQGDFCGGHANLDCVVLRLEEEGGSPALIRAVISLMRVLS